MTSDVVRPAIEELRLRAFKSYRGTVLPLAPLTVLHGPSAAGKSNALDALTVLSRLAGGAEIRAALDGGGNGPFAEPVRGGLAGCAPNGHRAFSLGCTVRTEVGPVRLDTVVRTEGGGVRIVRERLACGKDVLLETGEQNPDRMRINVTWHNDSRQGDIRAPFPSDSLITAQIPLRVAGSSAGERKVLAAAEQALTALREVFPADPAPRLMRGWAAAEPGALLAGSAANISAVLARMQGECRQRYGRLVKALRAASPYPLHGLDVARRRSLDSGAAEQVMAVFDEGALGRNTADRVADGMLRYLAFAAAMLTGAGVLDVDQAREVPWEKRLLTVAAEDLGAGLCRSQVAELLRLTSEMCAAGQVRVLTVLQDMDSTGKLSGVALVACARDPGTGRSVLRAGNGVSRAADPVAAAGLATAGLATAGLAAAGAAAVGTAVPGPAVESGADCVVAGEMR